MSRAAAILLVLLTVRVASAQEGSKAAAGRLVEEGIAAFERGDAPLALERFREAYRLYPSAKLHINMAAVLEKLGREAEAAAHYDRFLLETTAEEVTPEKRRRAQDALRRLEGRLARIRLAVDGPATLVVNSEPRMFRPGRPIHVAAGKVHLRVEAPGRKPAEWTAELGAGEERVAQVSLEPLPPAADPAPVTSPLPVAPPPPVRERPAARGRMWTWIVAATTAAVLAGGVAMWIATDQAYDDYREAASDDEWRRLRQRVEDRQLATRILFGVAAAGAVGTGILWYVEPAPGGVAVKVARSF